MLSLWASNPKKYKSNASIWMVLPPMEVELDVRGGVFLAQGTACIRVGEIKSSCGSSSRSKSKLQKVERALLIKWAVKFLHSSDQKVTLCGHKFYPKSDTEDSAWKPDDQIAYFLHGI
jgi:hypothetical protein